MNKQELGLLERAFDAEIGAALDGKPHVMQTKAITCADGLVTAGLLNKVSTVWRGIEIHGYELTHAGRFAYCATCEDEPE